MTDLLQRLCPSLLMARPWFLDKLIKINVAVSIPDHMCHLICNTHGSTLE